MHRLNAHFASTELPALLSDILSDMLSALFFLLSLIARASTASISHSVLKNTERLDNWLVEMCLALRLKARTIRAHGRIFGTRQGYPI